MSSFYDGSFFVIPREWPASIGASLSTSSLTSHSVTCPTLKWLLWTQGSIHWLVYANPKPSDKARIYNSVQKERVGQDAREASQIAAIVFKPERKANSLAKYMFPIIYVCVVNISYLWRLRQDGKVSCLTQVSAVSFWSSAGRLLECHHSPSCDGFGVWLHLGIWGACFLNWSSIRSCQIFLFSLNPQASEAFHGYNSGESGEKRFEVTFV